MKNKVLIMVKMEKGYSVFSVRPRGVYFRPRRAVSPEHALVICADEARTGVYEIYAKFWCCSPPLFGKP